MKGFICVLLVSGLLTLPLPAKSRGSQDISFPVTDAQSGAQGIVTYHLNDWGQVEYINAYAATADWSITAFWSGGSWIFSPVVLNDPTLPGERDYSFSSASWLNRPPPPPSNPPPVTDYPLSPAPGFEEQCPDCISKLREDCRSTWRAESVGAVVVGSAATVGCTAVTATIGFAICIVGGMAITGTATWIARTHFKQCWNAAPLACTDPGSGKQCSQLGY